MVPFILGLLYRVDVVLLLVAAAMRVWIRGIWVRMARLVGVGVGVWIVLAVGVMLSIVDQL